MAIPKVKERKKGDIQRMATYINLKVANAEGLADKSVTKKELALQAGYSIATVESNVLEKSNIYTDLSHDYINRTGFALNETLDEIKLSIDRGELKELSLIQQVRVASLLTSIYKGLLPTYKKKETKRDIDGTITSVWTTINQ